MIYQVQFIDYIHLSQAHKVAISIYPYNILKLPLYLLLPHKHYNYNPYSLSLYGKFIMASYVNIC